MKQNNTTPAPAEQNETAAQEQRPKNPYQKVNKLCGVLVGIGCLFGLSAYFLTFPLFLVAAVLNAALGIVSAHVQNHPKEKGFLYVLRTAGILSVAVMILPALFTSGFQHTPQFYPAKRFVYTYGMEPDGFQVIIPKQLPEHVSDYCCITEGAIAQGHPRSCYLMLHTDEDTLRQIEQEFIPQTSWLVRFDPPERDQDRADSLEANRESEQYFTVQCPELAVHAAARLWSAGFRDDLSEAVIWRTEESAYSKGILINHKTGLLMVWT